jgi:NAD(P)-dependent dehydrogenase (short-subunit alcohol dehydrogenase family)
MLGFVCLAYRGAYNASKYALEALSDTLRLELRGTGIHVSLIEPGPIQSDFRKNAYAAFKTNIRVDHSVHRDSYVALGTRARGQTPESSIPRYRTHPRVRDPKAPTPIELGGRIAALVEWHRHKILTASNTLMLRQPAYLSALSCYNSAEFVKPRSV